MYFWIEDDAKFINWLCVSIWHCFPFFHILDFLWKLEIVALVLISICILRYLVFVIRFCFFFQQIHSLYSWYPSCLAKHKTDENSILCTALMWHWTLFKVQKVSQIKIYDLSSPLMAFVVTFYLMDDAGLNF